MFEYIEIAEKKIINAKWSGATDLYTRVQVQWRKQYNQIVVQTKQVFADPSVRPTDRPPGRSLNGPTIYNSLQFSR